MDNPFVDVREKTDALADPVAVDRCRDGVGQTSGDAGAGSL
jgi:hypothetical protein